MSLLAAPYSLYLHIPFCRHRCAYCDFNTYAGSEALIPAYTHALCDEIAALGASASDGVPLPVHTVFFGGGTPSLLPLDSWQSIFPALRASFHLLPDAEITLEANPGTVDAAYLNGLRAVGFNRISFGMQSAHPDDLRALERTHDFFDVQRAVLWARRAGFDNCSVDLIFGLPQQSLPRWQETLTRAVDLGVEHLSLYALTIEHGTPLYRQFARGMLAAVDDDLAADQYDLARATLAAAGFEQYEISNWARRADGKLLDCLHNRQYWRSLPYLGLGAGAHGFIPTKTGGIRTANVGGIRPYIARLTPPYAHPAAFPASPAARRVLTLSAAESMGEYMMVGLRQTDQGIIPADFFARFGSPLTDVFGEPVARLTALGLLETVPTATGADCLRLTPRGVLLGNRVFMEFVGDA